MTDEQVDEAIEILALACNVENRATVTQALRRMVNSGGEIESRVLAERKPSAKERYDASECGTEETDPIERLRFFCSLAMNGRDWLDVEPFFDALAHPTPDDASVSVATLFEVLMQQNIVTSDESYLSLRCVGVPPTEEEFVQAVRRTIDAAIDRARQSGEEGND